MGCEEEYREARRRAKKLRGKKRLHYREKLKYWNKKVEMEGIEGTKIFQGGKKD